MVRRLHGLGHIPFERDEYYEWAKTYLIEGDDLPCKKEVYDALGYRILPTIKKLHASRATHRILGGGNRSGKTEAMAWEIVPYLFWKTSGWIVSHDYDMARVCLDKIITILLERAGLKRALQSTNLKEFEFCYAVRDHRLTMWTGATLELKSAQNPDSMHAVPLDYICLDEASTFPFVLYDTRLVPRLVDSGGWLLSVGTFEYLQGEWFEEYFQIGQSPNEWEIESWHHPTHDNYHHYVAGGEETVGDIAVYFHIHPSQVTKMNPDLDWPLKAEDEVFIYNVDLEWLNQERKRMDPNVYTSRYEATPAPNRYIVFPKWLDNEFIDADKTQFDPQLPVYIGVDPGGTYAVVVAQFKRFESNTIPNQLTGGYHCCIIDTIYYQSTVTTPEVISTCAQRIWWPNLGRGNERWDNFQGAIDVAAREQARIWYRDARKDGVLQHLSLRRRKIKIDDGIRTLQHYLDTRTIWSHPRNNYLHLEFKRYHWPVPSLSSMDTRDPRRGRNPVKEWDHLLNALWYLLIGRFGIYMMSHSSVAVTAKDRRDVRKKKRAGVNIYG